MVQPVTDILGRKDGTVVLLTRELQFFSFDLMALVVYGKVHSQLTKAEYDDLANRWSGIMGDTTAFTNGTASRNNHITGEVEAGYKDIAFDKRRTCGLATHTGTVIKNDLGREMVALDYFDITKPLQPVETIDPLGDYRVFIANIITTTKVPGGYKVNRFPQLSTPAANKYFDVPIPLFSASPIYYPRDRVRELPPGTPDPSPYFP